MNRLFVKLPSWLSLPLLLLGVFISANVVRASVLEKQSKVLGTTTNQKNGNSGMVLAATTPSKDFVFSINVPANFKGKSKFYDTVEFIGDIVAPNVVYSVTAGIGIDITNGQIPTISNAGVLSLNGLVGKVTMTAGDGISLDGLKIINTGIRSLEAGNGISVDGNKISNTYSFTPDYTQGGWTRTGTSVGLTTTTDSVVLDTITFGNATVTNGKSILPDTDLGSDLGSSGHRFNNLWVGTINSNSSQGFSGQTTFSYPPTNTLLTDASVLINPTTSVANGQLLGLGIAGYQRALIDEDGDMVLGYNSLTSAPATDNPLNIYGHSGTMVSSVDTSGNGYFAGNVGIGTTTPSSPFVIKAGGLDVFTVNSQGSISYAFGGSTLNTGGLTMGQTAPYVGGGAATNYVTVFGGAKTTSQLILKSTSGVGTTGADIIFQVGNNGATEAMRILNSGFVGIGTTSPGGTLHVAGSSTTNTLFGTGGTGFIVDTSNGLFKLGNGGYIDGYYGDIYLTGTVDATAGVKRISTAANRHLSLMPGVNGNVGIGVTNPASKLDVLGSAGLSPFNVASSSGTSIFNVAANGNVGIGTTNPSQKLEVTGNILLSGGSKIYGTSNGSGGVTFDATGTKIGGGSYVGINLEQAGSYIDFTKNSVSQMRLDGATGNVGIGTTAPTSKLHLSGAVTGKALAIFNETGTDQALFTASASGVSKFIIDHSGNVGIGTTSPGAKLSFVAGTTAADGIDFGGDTNIYRGAADSLRTDDSFTVNGLFTMNNQIRAYAYGSISAPAIAFNGDSNTGFFDTGLNANTIVTVTDGVERMRVDPNGLVGIGNTAPGYKLDILGSAGLSPFNVASSSGTSILNIAANGFVGIGTTNPSTALEINGTVKGLTTLMGDGNASTPSISFSSDPDNGVYRVGTNSFALSTAGSARQTISQYGSFTYAGNSQTAEYPYYFQHNPQYYNTGGYANFYFLHNLLNGQNDNSDTNDTMYIKKLDSLSANPTGYTISGSVLKLEHVVTPSTGFTDTTEMLTLLGTSKSSGNLMNIKVDNISKLVIDINGNVGIGTTVPTSKLHLSGAVTGKALAIFDETGTDQALFTASASGVSKFIIDHSGNVGIGITNPSTSLHVTGIIRQDNAYGLAAYGITAGYFSNSANLSLTSGPTTGSILFSAGPSERLRIDGATGNVGIGTTAPTSKLHLSGAVTGKALAIFNETGTDQALFTASASGTTKLTVLHNGLVDASAGGLATYSKAGTISDTDFADTAVDGLFGFDTTNHRLYFREGSAWSYIAKTGGFQIPNFEAEGLAQNDYLMPYVENTMSDGAVHGMYKKFSDVKKELLADIYKLFADMKEKFITKQSIQEEMCIGTEENKTCLNKEQVDLVIKNLPTPEVVGTTTTSATISVSPTPTPTPEPILTPISETIATSSGVIE